MARTKSPEEKSSLDWEAIESSPFARAYISEVYWLSRDTAETCQGIFENAPAPPQSSSYIKVDHGLHRELHRVLNNAARIRALIKSRPRSKSQGAGMYALDAARAAALKAHLERTKLIHQGTGVHPLSGRLICPCGERMTGIIRSDRANRRYRCRRAHQVPGRPFCHEPSVLGDKVDDAVWAQVLDLLMDPDLLMALASERLDMLRGAARVTVDSLGDAEAAVMRLQKALASGVAKCLTLDLDEGTTMATMAELREQHREAVQHRSMVAAMNQETADAAARMVTAQQLAAVARERLQSADRVLQAKVFALLDVRVTILEHGDQVRVRVEGSVAHDLLLSSVSGGLAPSKLAPHHT